jgi:hypothetical protein
VSFFLYSLFIYPVTNYLVSPKRSYPRWKGACYAMLFLVAISSVHMVRGLDVRPLLAPISLVHVIHRRRCTRTARKVPITTTCWVLHEEHQRQT